MDAGRCRQLCGDRRLAFGSMPAGKESSKSAVRTFVHLEAVFCGLAVDRKSSPRAALRSEAAFRFVDRDHVVLGGEIPARLFLPGGLAHLALKRLEVPRNLAVGHEGGEAGLDVCGKGGGELLDQRPKSRPSASGGAFVATQLGRGWSTARPIV